MVSNWWGTLRNITKNVTINPMNKKHYTKIMSLTLTTILTLTPTPATAYTLFPWAPHHKPHHNPQPQQPTLAQKIVNTALQQQGKPYQYGATGPNSFDCSGLTTYAYKQHGITIPRTSYQQATAGTHADTSHLQPGDIILYSGNGHAALYIGNGKIVHAPQEGQNVQTAPINIMPISETRRIINK